MTGNFSRFRRKKKPDKTVGIEWWGISIMKTDYDYLGSVLGCVGYGNLTVLLENVKKKRDCIS